MPECRNCNAALPGRSARVYCSLSCQQAHQRAVRIQRWLQTGTATAHSQKGHYVRRYIADEQAHRCALCGMPDVWNELPLSFVLDHVDGDSANNRRENLRLICPNCDSQLPTYKSRNRGRGRHSRRVRYAAGQSY